MSSIVPVPTNDIIVARGKPRVAVSLWWFLCCLFLFVVVVVVVVVFVGNTELAFWCLLFEFCYSFFLNLFLKVFLSP